MTRLGNAWLAIGLGAVALGGLLVLAGAVARHERDARLRRLLRDVEVE